MIPMPCRAFVGCIQVHMYACTTWALGYMSVSFIKRDTLWKARLEFGGYACLEIIAAVNGIVLSHKNKHAVESLCAYVKNAAGRQHFFANSDDSASECWMKFCVFQVERSSAWNLFHNQGSVPPLKSKVYLNIFDAHFCPLSIFMNSLLDFTASSCWYWTAWTSMNEHGIAFEFGVDEEISRKRQRKH